MINKFELTVENENPKQAEIYFNENIDSLVVQCKSNIKNISYMAGFSFLEGYLRNRFPEILGFDKAPASTNFNEIITAYINYFCNSNPEISFIEKHNRVHITLLLNDLNSSHRKTNSIRHTFSMEEFDKGSYYQLFLQLKEFFRLMGIKKEGYSKFDSITNDSSIFLDQVNGGFLQYFSDSNETFFQHYEKLINFLDEKELLSSSLKDIIDNNKTERIQKILDSYNADEYNKKLTTFSKDEEYLRNLSYSLLQEYLGRDYHKEFEQMIEPNELQEEILKTSLQIIKENPDNYVLITGAPGTGKTIVLIRLLIQLLKSNNPSQLVTFSESLELYNKHFSEEYNKNTKEISSAHMHDFQNNLIKSFADWIKEPLRVFLKVNELYPDYETFFEKLDVKTKRAFQTKYEKTYRKAMSEVWPNLKDADEEDIVQLHYFLDTVQNEENGLPLEYAYWKFVKTVTQEDMVTLRINAPCPDYILIDEVQDLTLAQLQSAKKVAKYGAIFAGDLNQCIRRNYNSWAELGIDPSFGKELTRNYRTSYNIQKLSNSFLEKSGKHTYTLNDENKIQGPKPQLFVSEESSEYSFHNASKQIAYSVKMLLETCKREMKDIFIVASTQEELLTISTYLKSINSGIKTHYLKNSDNQDKKLFSENSIKLGTIESIKGIDCPILLFLITQNLINNYSEELIQDSIYAVINRAMHLLEVFMPNQLLNSKAIGNLINLLKSDLFDQEISLMKNIFNFYPERVGKYSGRSGIPKDYVYGKLEDGREGFFSLDSTTKLSVDNNTVLDYVYTVQITRTDKHKTCFLTPITKLEKGTIIERTDNNKTVLFIKGRDKEYEIHKDSCKTSYETLKAGDEVCFDIGTIKDSKGTSKAMAGFVGLFQNQKLFPGKK